MYIPHHFRVEDEATLFAAIESWSFATLVTVDADGAPFASHLPLLLDREQRMLFGHMARPNPQWRHFENGATALAIFHGPHAYISPSHYTTELAVPTWNYAAVHVRGRALLDDDAARVADVLRQTIARYEDGRTAPWRGDLPDEFWQKLQRGVVGFAIEIGTLEGKWKISQNRSLEDRRGVHEAMQNGGDDERALAEIMKSFELLD